MHENKLIRSQVVWHSKERNFLLMQKSRQFNFKLVLWIYFETVGGSEGWDPRDRETAYGTPPFAILRYV